MLQDIEARKAKPRDKAYKLTDERGLYLLANPSGGKLWRMNYRFDGKQKTLSFGNYPDVGLADARGKRDDARKKIAAGIDPMGERKAMKSAKTIEAETFEVIAREWHDKFSPTWTAEHGERILKRFDG